MIAVSDADRNALILTVWGEARGETPLGQEAVAHVILNRAADPGWWGTNVYEVCHCPYQFSSWNKNDPNVAKMQTLCASDEEYQRIAANVNGALTGLAADPTGGADHYKVFGTRASWDSATVGKPGLVIGHHVFFKLGRHA